MLKKSEVIAYTKRLDSIANEVQSNWQDYGLSKKAAYNFCLHVDKLSDRLENIVGLNKRADTLQMDADEPYMKNYDMAGVIDGMGDADEPYMDLYKDDHFDQFEDPMEGETSEELQNTKSSSYDYWDDSRTASGDYWDDSRTASGDYWDDEF